jgi:hypothetical protein
MMKFVGGLEGGIQRIPAKHREAAERPELDVECLSVCQKAYITVTVSRISFRDALWFEG